MITAELTYAEMLLAAQVGCMRQVQNIKNGRKAVYGNPSGDWQVHIEGAMGECAFAKTVGVYWSGSLGNLKAGDVGAYQVRTTKHKNGCLILHDRDKDEDMFVLVIGENGKYRIAGQITGRHGKQKQFWKDVGNGRPAYFVPQKFLEKLNK